MTGLIRDVAVAGASAAIYQMGRSQFAGSCGILGLAAHPDVAGLGSVQAAAGGGG